MTWLGWAEMICDIKWLFDLDEAVTSVHAIHVHHSCQLGDIAARSYVAITTANCCVTAVYFLWCIADNSVLIVCPRTRNIWHSVCSCFTDMAIFFIKMKRRNIGTTQCPMVDGLLSNVRMFQMQTCLDYLLIVLMSYLLTMWNYMNAGNDAAFRIPCYFQYEHTN